MSTISDISKSNTLLHIGLQGSQSSNLVTHAIKETLNVSNVKKIGQFDETQKKALENLTAHVQSQSMPDLVQSVQAMPTVQAISAVQAMPTVQAISAVQTILPVQSAQTITADEDRKKIEDALGGTEQSHIEKFEKEYGQTFQSIMNATVKELAIIRQSSQLKIGFGGLKKAGIKKWKLIVKLEDDGKINELFIGRYKTSGSFNKVYLTLNEKAILVPKKNRASAIAVHDAYDHISFLHDQYKHKENCTTLMSALHYSEEDFSKEVQELLPPMPKKIMTEQRPVLVVPRATCVGTKFHNPPNNAQDTKNRIKILRDVAVSVALSHAQGLIHGDLKPDNMLISHSGRGQQHDLGGSYIFDLNASPQEKVHRYVNVSRTVNYIHYQDHLACGKIIAQVAQGTTNGDQLSQLGYARDVFALGISTIEVLIGLHDSDGNIMRPFETYFYCNGFVDANADQYNDFSCIRDISKQIDKRFQSLLESALQPIYTKRISALGYAMALNNICKELEM